jgi:hypothetical protein
MTILITPDGYVCESEETPQEGKRYILYDADEHTWSQTKTVHALIGVWFKSGLWDYDTIDYVRFRDFVKKDYGAGFSHYEYVTDSLGMERVKTLVEIPQEILDDFSNGNSRRIKAVLKSFTDYTKKECMAMIDNLINVMTERGVDTPKFRDIMRGLEDEQNRKAKK